MARPKTHIPGSSPASPVVLMGRAARPVVLGVPQEVLTEAQYDVVEALLAAGPDGLSLRELAQKSRRPAPQKTLNAMRQSGSSWEAVIVMAGRAHGRYRISWPDQAAAISSMNAALTGELPSDPDERRRLAIEMFRHGAMLATRGAEILDALYHAGEERGQRLPHKKR